MVFKKKLKILFFINGSSPTPNDELNAMELDGTICFRNAEFAGLPEQGIEDCDGVAGDYIPKAYAKRFPTAKEAIVKNKEALVALRKKTGDEIPPKVDDDKEEEKEQVAAEETEESKKIAEEASKSTDTKNKPAWGGKK